MLTLETKIELNKAAIESPNLCEFFTDDDLAQIGNECHAGYLRDEQSRTNWLRRNEAGMDLALQIQKDKTFPWANCANVTFPLITIAAMQFHARAYPAIISGDQLVRCITFNDDPTNETAARGSRVSTHMSWQLLHEDVAWEDQEDKALLNLSIVGTNFKKTYYSPALGHNVSELVLAKDLVMSYWSKSVESTPRKTHRIPKFRNEVYENVVRGIWRDILEEAWYNTTPAPKTTSTSAAQDQRQGVTPPLPDDTSSLLFLEQHVNLDLDGDGYAEPYIITFEENSHYVVRIVTRFDSEASIERAVRGKRKGQIVRIEPTEYFTKKTFIPSPDGGIYDIGFGVFLGPLNEATNSLTNMLLDAGTLQTTAGGFLGRGAKIRGGVNTFSPFEWKRVDATGDDLRKNIMPLPVNAPSDVLFQLLSLLINYTSRISGTTDITVGENPGQNTPAQTTQTMVEMGQKIYTAIFKRVWRANREELQKLYKLNAIYLATDHIYPGGATVADYAESPHTIAPMADPNVSSDSEKFRQALMIKQAAATTPGYDKDAVERRFLKALRAEGIEEIFKGANGQPPGKDAKVAVAEIQAKATLEAKQLDIQGKQIQAQTELQMFALELEETRKLNSAKIIELQAKALEASANAQSEQAYAQMATINAQISLMESENKRINIRIEHLLKAADLELKHQGAKNADAGE